MKLLELNMIDGRRVALNPANIVTIAVYGSDPTKAVVKLIDESQLIIDERLDSVIAYWNTCMKGA